MSYIINLKIENSTHNEYLTIIEKTVYGCGGWTEHNNEHDFDTTSNSTSGILRFRSSKNELFTVAVGIHNWKPWGDVQVDLGERDTALSLNPQYYGSASRLHREWYQDKARPTKTGKSVKITFAAPPPEGHVFYGVISYSYS
ncbi:fungal fruit body lectin [Aspergillus californicus]